MAILWILAARYATLRADMAERKYLIF